jgi:hypothetical protein
VHVRLTALQEGDEVFAQCLIVICGFAFLLGGPFVFFLHKRFLFL